MKNEQGTYLQIKNEILPKILKPLKEQFGITPSEGKLLFDREYFRLQKKKASNQKNIDSIEEYLIDSCLKYGKFRFNDKEKEWKESLKQEDKYAWKKIYKECFHLVSNYLQEKGTSFEESQDIFHESIIVLFEYLSKPDFRLDSKINTFLTSVAKNIWFKKIERTPQIMGDDFLYDLELLTPAKILVSIEESEKLAIIRKCLNSLPENERAIIDAKYFEGLTHNQLSLRYGISIGAARAKLFRAIAKLRTNFQDNPQLKAIRK